MHRPTYLHASCHDKNLQSLQNSQFYKRANPGLFLSILILHWQSLRNNFERLQQFRSWIIGVEGEHADH